MSRIAYVNGRYVPHAQAQVHIEDRGYQFADGVYEVCEILKGRLVDRRLHMDRLERSLRELSITPPMSRLALGMVLDEVVVRNRVREGFVYLQITRGVARRDHAFPTADIRPAVVATVRSISREKNEHTAEEGISVITMPDNRWERVDIKTVGLLPNAIAKTKAREAGAKEAWLVDADGFVTEGASTTAWIVTQDGVLVTRPNGTGILPGITRMTATRVAEREGIRVEERKFTVDEAKRAREAFSTGATTIITPIVEIDGSPVANGKPGSIAMRLRAAFHEVAELD
ncbi:D-alanine aminotransferase apoenzyme [Faunimonas pinastri]|uniref:Probable branched-chain-amino-acid aminotransferase n=1 Tax=Faunimonas pinastri TaxID=1855383 RepID=A0A1H9N6U9_9HYPH|nr:D-amino-acid transaminase [Faunimonas pinastri]SER31628.1 D-alanine aminotransferase apoenzyme [Faunimonas pinastri]